MISDAGAFATYLKLIPRDYPLEFRESLSASASGISHVSLYIGFKEDPRKLGFQGENHWIFGSEDHDDVYARRNELLDGKASFCYLSTPSLKDPAAKRHTAEAIALVDYEPFKKWAARPWKKRGREYEELKERIMETLFQTIEEHFKGFRELISYKELSTPLSTELFTGHRDGAIYGFPAGPDRYRKPWLGIRTPVKNFFLSGSDVLGHGIGGALMGGVMTSTVAMGVSRLPKIFRTAMEFSRSLER